MNDSIPVLIVTLWAKSDITGIGLLGVNLLHALYTQSFCSVICVIYKSRKTSDNRSIDENCVLS